MDTHSLQVLEFHHVIAMLRERTACSLGDDLATQLRPTTDLLAIDRGQNETSEAKRILDEEGCLPLGGIHDIRVFVNKAAIGSMCQPTDLLRIADTLGSGRSLRGFILKRIDHCHTLGEVAVNIGQFPKIEQEINAAVGDNGEIRDSASQELARIRSKLKTTHSRMMDKLNSIIHSSEFRTMIQDPVVTQRGDRYCIPVKSEFRAQLPGVVHDSSASGATVFIEPSSVVDMGNDIRELTVKEVQEIEKILRRLSGMVKAAAPEIKLTLDAIAIIDLASAKARLSCDMDASEPELNRKGEVDLKKARHPLLTGDVVPIDIELGRRFNVLLITGPNTGGKTVTLKTLGLLALMAQSGLHIPALSGSKIAIFDEIFADIGDEQSIQQSLSTFSSHMTNIVGLTRRVAPNCLVLLDEVGAGTDPAEGAALAKAILDHLAAKGARVVATTHYGELKEFAFVRDGVENASVEFDVETLRPTYRLMIGVPGSSNAFAIARRLGLSEEIVQSARDMVQGGEESEEIIRKIEQTHRVATEREQVAERSSRDAEDLKSRYQQRLDEIETLRREMRHQLAEEVDRRVHEKIRELDQVISELKSRPVQVEKPDRDIQAGRELFNAQVKLIREEVEELLPDVREEPDGPFVLKRGDPVRITTLNTDGELVNEPGEAQAIVMVGSMKITVPFDVLIPGRRSKKKEKEAPYDDGSSRISAAKSISISGELKLIAQRVEPALETLDKYIDDAYLAGLSSVRIIHGVGTGAMKKAVWQYLANHHAVASYNLAEQNEGGAGATIVKFKNK